MPICALEKHESQIEYQHFSRMLYAVAKQWEYNLMLGPVLCYAIYLLRWPFYQAWAKRTRPLLVTFECQGKVIGGIMVGKLGEIGTPVVTRDKVLHVQAMKLLSQWIDELLVDQSKRFFIKTFESNVSIIAAAKRRGFVLSNMQEYVMILKLGLINLVWYSSTPKTLFPKLIEVHHMLLLERPARVG